MAFSIDFAIHLDTVLRYRYLVSFPRQYIALVCRQIINYVTSNDLKEYFECTMKRYLVKVTQSRFSIDIYLAWSTCSTVDVFVCSFDISVFHILLISVSLMICYSAVKQCD